MIKIIIADDHPLIREGFKKILSYESDIEICSIAENGTELLKILSKTKCDVVIADLNMPGKSGVDLIKDIKTSHPKTKVLVVSAYSEEEFGMRLLKSGISGYVPKDSAAEELVDAIRTVAQGQKYITKSLANKLASSFNQTPTSHPHEKLSDREFQILCLIAEGLSVNQIADKLSISSSTVNTYHTRICEKMDMKSNAELIRYAIQNKLVE